MSLDESKGGEDILEQLKRKILDKDAIISKNESLFKELSEEERAVLLYDAIKSKNHLAVSTLLKAGANPNFVDLKNRFPYPLLAAFLAEDAHAVDELLRGGANPDGNDEQVRSRGAPMQALLKAEVSEETLKILDLMEKSDSKTFRASFLESERKMAMVWKEREEKP